jgi:RNA polymerase sigma-70 factor (ECF subfamily)
VRGLSPQRTAPAPAAADPAERRRLDLELARRCIAGERAAERELFQRELDRVHRILYRILGRGADAEDATQEAMVALFRSLPRYRGDATLGTWVDRITVRTALRALARRRAAPAPLDDAGPLMAPGPGADAELVRHETGQRLYAALEKLDPRMRVAFVLHVIEERTAAEVAALMSATLVATKARIWRARRELEKRARRDPRLAVLLDEEGGRR